MKFYILESLLETIDQKSFNFGVEERLFESRNVWELIAREKMFRDLRYRHPLTHTHRIDVFEEKCFTGS